MKELIWFSVSGAFWVIGVLVLCPRLVVPDSAALFIAATPVVGFIVHELYRNVFEGWRGGYASEKRRSLRVLWDGIASKVGFEEGDTRWAEKGFLIWETTFYGNGIPGHAKEHDRESWHYIIAFRSGAFNGILTAVLLPLGGAIYYFGFSGENIVNCLGVFWFVLAAVLAAWILNRKADLSEKKLIAEETAIILCYAGAFKKTAVQLARIDGRWNDFCCRGNMGLIKNAHEFIVYPPEKKDSLDGDTGNKP